MRLPLRFPVLALALLLGGCAHDVDVATAERVPLRFDKANAERLARYYLGGLAGPDGADPVEAGLLEVDGGDLFVRPQALTPEQRAALAAADVGSPGAIDWDEFADFAAATYADARALPPTLDALRAAHGDWRDDAAWFGYAVEGSAMTHARRRLRVPVAALRAALRAHADGGALAYPPGTLLVGEHLGEGGAVAETTVKRRRADGFWDFAVYDADGALAGRTATPPRPLAVPVQCTGCHLGRRQFEPEESFPAAAPVGPAGPRAVVAPEAWRDAETAARFREHATRADGVLGLYATLYVGRLKADRAAGRPLAPEDAALLDALGG